MPPKNSEQLLNLLSDFNALVNNGGKRLHARVKRSIQHGSQSSEVDNIVRNTRFKHRKGCTK